MNSERPVYAHSLLKVPFSQGSRDILDQMNQASHYADKTIESLLKTGSCDLDIAWQLRIYSGPFDGGDREVQGVLRRRAQEKLSQYFGPSWVRVTTAWERSETKRKQ